MIEFVLASHNPKKIRELDALFSAVFTFPFRVLSLSDIGYSGDIVENGNSFSENAVIKASVPASRGYIGIADDSGLCVDALGGAPGVYSARYSGADANDARNNAKLLTALFAIDYPGRTARFHSAVACVFPDHSADFVCEADCEGEILRVGRGNDGFGYDPLFFYPPFSKTFAELSMEEKNRISHRGKAMRELAARLSKLIPEGGNRYADQ